jgi:hypothetical protein
LFTNKPEKKFLVLIESFMHPCVWGAFNFSLQCRYIPLQHRRRLLMISDLFSLLVDEMALFQTSGAHDLAPWSGLSWALFVPLAFATNVAVAVFAWLVIEWFAKLM